MLSSVAIFHQMGKSTTMVVILTSSNDNAIKSSRVFFKYKTLWSRLLSSCVLSNSRHLVLPGQNGEATHPTSGRTDF